MPLYSPPGISADSPKQKLSLSESEQDTLTLYEEAYESLLKEQAPITHDNLMMKRESLGYGRGSRTTAAKYRKIIEIKRGLQTLPSEETGSINNEPMLTNPVLMRGLQQLNDYFRQQVSEQFQTTVDQLEEKLKKAETTAILEKQRCQEALQVIDQQLSRLEVSEQEQQRLKVACQKQKDLTQQAQAAQQIAEAFLQQHQAHHEKQQRECQTVHQQTVDTLQQQIIELKKDRREEVDNLKQIQENQRHEWMQRCDTQKVRYQALEKKQGTIQLQYQNLMTKHDELKENTQKTQRSYEELKARHTDALAELIQIKEQCVHLKLMVEDKITQLNEKSNVINKLQTEYESHQKKLTTLQIDYQVLLHQIQSSTELSHKQENLSDGK